MLSSSGKLKMAPSQDGVRRLSHHLAVLLLLSAAMACAPLRSTPTPMPTLALSPPQEDTSRLYVLLPGMLDKPQTFAKKGVAEIIMAADPAADIIAADAHFNYYRKRIVFERLQEDVLAPARAQGYQEIWLVGVSLGGFSSTLTASKYPEEIAGILLLAPFLGDEKDLRQVDLLQADFDPENPGETKPKIRALITAWNWLDEAVADPAQHPRIILGYGEDDGLVVGNQRLAERLPEEDVFVVPGGHDWQTWRRLLALSLPRVHDETSSTP